MKEKFWSIGEVSSNKLVLLKSKSVSKLMESWEWQGELNRSPFEWYEEEITQDYVVLFHQSVKDGGDDDDKD
jgi:hypothetical protein